VTISVDGLGWNVLERWPDSWPYLKQLMESQGTNISDAVVGSSPSITPAVHTNMSTGAFPRDHGVTAIAVRRRNGDIVGGFALSPDSRGEPSEADPTINLRMETLSDLWDREHDNEAQVAMIAGGNYVTGFVGNGAALESADKDIAAFHGKNEAGDHIWATNPTFYSVPEYVNTEVDGPEGDMEAVDASDGEVDGKWRGHFLNLDGSPALTPWQVRSAIELIDREGFGDDDIADLFYLHLKAPDAAGHLYNMIAEEQAEVIESVDRGIEELIGYLDSEMPGEYVLTLTADHGQTPTDTGAWAITRDEIYKDIGERFGGVIERTSSTTFFMDKAEMKERGITVEKVASFMSRYRIGDNIPPGEEVEGAEDRLQERLFEAVFPGKALPKIVSCTGALEG
jgi:predicted AlkP superfamily pyrophosphatase or phosphodiesterase